MDSQRFNFPSVDNLKEGIDYTIVDWNFAAAAPTPTPSHNPGEPCPPNQKMVFGVCRRVNASGEQQVGDDSDQERALKEQATKEGSAFENNKAITADGKKYGWAMKGGKPVMVAWGSVAGVKKVGPKQAPQPAKAASPAGGSAKVGGGSAASAAPRATAAAPARSTGVGSPLSTADRAAYAAGGGNAAAQRGMGSSTEQVIAQGRRNLERMNQGRGRS